MLKFNMSEVSQSSGQLDKVLWLYLFCDIFLIFGGKEVHIYVCIYIKWRSQDFGWRYTFGGSASQGDRGIPPPRRPENFSNIWENFLTQIAQYNIYSIGSRPRIRVALEQQSWGQNKFLFNNRRHRIVITPDEYQEIICRPKFHCLRCQGCKHKKLSKSPYST